MILSYEFEIRGEADVERGPLGQFIDLELKIEEEGGTVPPELKAVLRTLEEASEPKEHKS
jgi:hypothetical protein